MRRTYDCNGDYGGTMNFLSLCSGIGGIDIAAEWAGMTIVGQVEIDEYCSRVLEKHWPHVTRKRDIKDAHGKDFGHVDIIAGGIPCQGNSVLGGRKGMEDDRYLWPQMLRLVEETRSPWLLLENVAGILSVNDGALFGKVLQDLAERGYSCAWLVHTARAVGAPHTRKRVFLIGRKDVGNSSSTRCGNELYGSHSSTDTSAAVSRQAEPSVARSIDGVSRRLDETRWPARRGEPQYNWEPPRVSYGRKPYDYERRKALGNAVVPLQVYPILRKIYLIHTAGNRLPLETADMYNEPAYD